MRAAMLQIKIYCHQLEIYKNFKNEGAQLKFFDTFYLNA